jgi:hypothetical protein
MRPHRGVIEEEDATTLKLGAGNTSAELPFFYISNGAGINVLGVH